MTLSDLTGLLTAVATAATVALLAWDRVEKMRLPNPVIEVTSLWLDGAKRKFNLEITIRNRAGAGLRISDLHILSPKGAKFTARAGDGTHFRSWQTIAPGGVHFDALGLELPEDRESLRARSIKLKVSCTIVFVTSRIIERRFTISRRL